ncbi:MAG: putative DNA binding domain-containing protein [Deltaproteobacteria bacterium]|nr:putative DNA binding domain-containing protein [Deltaproteobacteria bacterium]
MKRQKLKESETIELKKSLAELKQGLISIASILNKHQAGTLWFGVDNNGEITGGVSAGEKTLRDLSQTVAAHIEPKIFPEITLEQLEGKICIKVVFKGKDTPYFAYGKAYIRVADEDRQLSASELKHIILEKAHVNLNWDSEPSGKGIRSIDHEKLKIFIKKTGLSWSSPVDVLKKLDVLKNDKVLNAATLFFAKSPLLLLRCAVFSGITSSDILDRHDFEGDILMLIEEAQKYILKNIHIGMQVKGLYREDIPEISKDAIREAIINAFCHRDYRDPDYVQVAVFKDRVEIRNPGGLLEGLTIEELRMGNVSKRRNPLVAELLRRIHMVEAWGRGIPLILEMEPDVEFKEIAKLFITSFKRRALKDVTAKGEKTKNGKSPTPKETPKKPKRNPKEIILNILKELPSLSIREIAEQSGMSVYSVQHQINRLKEDGVIKHVGPTKGGRWEGFSGQTL